MRATTFQVLGKMMRELSGKNSVGKLVQYVLRLLVHYSRQVQSRTKISQISLSPQAWLAMLLVNPITTIRLARLRFLQSHVDAFDGVAGGLSIFRQTLRFGLTPFRIHKVATQIRAVSKNGAYSTLVGDDFVTLMIDTLYGIVDEIGLLFKWKYLDAKVQPRFKRFIGKSDEVLWMADILYQLKIGYTTLKKLQTEREILVENETQDEKIPADVYLQKLDLLEHQISLTRLGLWKLVCDFGFDLIDLFEMALVSRYIYYGLGAGSGLFNTLKTFKATKRALEG